MLTKLTFVFYFHLYILVPIITVFFFLKKIIIIQSIYFVEFLLPSITENMSIFNKYINVHLKCDLKSANINTTKKPIYLF